jgi:hypothetical protein
MFFLGKFRGCSFDKNSYLNRVTEIKILESSESWISGRKPYIIAQSSMKFMVNVAQLVEHQIVALVAVGSIPTIHPMMSP